MGFQSVEEKCDRQQVGAAARAETAHHEGSMHCHSTLAPVCLLDPALFEKAGRCFLGVAQPDCAATVKQIGIIHRRQDCEESLYARSLRILGRQPPTEPKCWQANLDCVRETSGGLCTRPARAELEQRVRAMAVERDWAAYYRLSPSLTHG